MKDLMKIKREIVQKEKELKRKKEKLKLAFTADDFDHFKSDFELLSQFKELHLDSN